MTSSVTRTVQVHPHKCPNTSGIQPVEYKVLVKLDPAETMSKGGIITSVGTESDRVRMAQVKGTLVARGGNAFGDWKGYRPEPGVRVMISMHAGIICEGDDGEEYRLCQDKDIAAVTTSITQE